MQKQIQRFASGSTCRDCGRTIAQGTEYWYDAVAKHGRRAQCVTCHDASEQSIETEHSTSIEETSTEVVTTVAPKIVPKAVDLSDPLRHLAASLLPHLEDLGIKAGIGIDYAQIGEHVTRAVETLRASMTHTVHIEQADGETTTVEGAHPQLADVLRILQAGLHPYIWGGAGGGKTTAAIQCAEVLGLPHWVISLNPQASAILLTGYMTPGGEKYVGSPFRTAFEDGGVLILDEFDNGPASVYVILNSALANGSFTFPDGVTVRRHPDFKLVACGNTTLRGRSSQYVARQRIDGATISRFVFVHWRLDESLETRLVTDLVGSEQATTLLKTVRRIRSKASEQNLDLICGMREAIYCARLMSAGWALTEALDMVVRRGLEQAQWSML